MDKLQIQKYMNPITFEAEMFVNNLEALSKVYKSCDVVLVTSLEKVMNAIEKFLDSNPAKIVATENTKLVACDNLNHIKRIYHCSRCKTDLGKSVEKVTLHLIEQCAQHSGGEVAAVGEPRRPTSEANSVRDSNQKRKKTRNELRRENMMQKQDKRMEQAINLTKKTRAFLTSDLNKFFDDQVKIGTKLKCIPDYEMIENDLMALITPLFPNKKVKIYKFGSRIAGIGTRESDLDLFVDIGGESFHVFRNRADDDTLAKLQKVGNAFMKRRSSWKGLVEIQKARVPILKVIHGGTGIECDINFSNSMGSINTQFLEYIFNLQPISRLLSIFFKKWIYLIGLGNELSTYSVILMIIFYLQNMNVLPSMKKFQENINEENAVKIGPWLCSYATLTLNDLNIKMEDVDQPNLLKFIRGFFMFYVKYNFDKDVICPYLGKSIKKNELESQMPKRYTDYVKKSADYALQLDKVIVVQDPIQLNHNVTKGLSTFTSQILKTSTAKSLNVLNETFLF
ncbi:tailor [Cochliomyia hominivorax]